jgi:hypothetical protein
MGGSAAMGLRAAVALVVAAAPLACSSEDPATTGSGGAGGDGAQAGASTTSGNGGATSTSGSGGGGNTGPDACAGAALGDGSYCGASLDPPGDSDTLYVCAAGATVKASVCSAGCAPQPPGTPDACAPDASGTPTGKGVWIETFGVSAPAAAAVAARAETLGVGFVLIKSGEDYLVHQENLDADIAAEFESRGIWVFAWNRVRPGDVTTKGALIAAQANVEGVRGIIVDVQSEWETAGAAAEATALCDTIRGGLDDGKKLGFSSFGWIDNHPALPYQALDAGCGDLHLPKVSWKSWGLAPDAGLAKAVDGSAALGLTAPLWPVQDNQQGAPDAAGLNAFFAAAGATASLWRWPGPDDTALDAQLDELDWAN